MTNEQIEAIIEIICDIAEACASYATSDPNDSQSGDQTYYAKERAREKLAELFPNK